MKPIQKDELYENLSQFLKTKGIELKEGSYSKGIHAGCSFLADAINLSQAGIERAKAGIDKGLEQVRQVIHEKTAPKPPVNAAPTPSAAAKRGEVAMKAAARSSAGKKRSKGSASRTKGR